MRLLATEGVPLESGYSGEAPHVGVDLSDFTQLRTSAAPTQDLPCIPLHTIRAGALAAQGAIPPL